MNRRLRGSAGISGAFDVARMWQTADNVCRRRRDGGAFGRAGGAYAVGGEVPDHPVGTGAAAQVCRPAIPGFPRPAEGAQPGRADHGARRGDRPLVRDPRRQGDLRRGAARRRRRDPGLQDRGDGRRAADAADRLARSDQRAEGFQAHGRGARGPHQLVRPDHHDEPERRLPDRHPARRRHHALLQHDQRRSGVRLRQGRQDRPHDADRLRRRRSAAVDHSRPRARAHAAAQDHARAARPERQVDRLFARPAASSDEARRLRPRGRAQSAEPRQVRLCPHLVGGGARPGRRRDQAAQAHLRARRDGRVARVAPYLGQHRLLPLGTVPVPQCRRLHPDPSQSRQLGRLVLGRCASLGLHAARRTIGDLWHGRGLPAELRHDRVLGGRSRKHVRLLRCAGRHRAPAVAQEPQARDQGRSRRPVFQCVGAVPARQVAGAPPDDLGRDGDGDRLCLDHGGPLRQGVRAHPHDRLRQVEGLPRRRGGRHPEDAGMAGEGNRRPRQGRTRAGA